MLFYVYFGQTFAKHRVVGGLRLIDRVGNGFIVSGRIFGFDDSGREVTFVFFRFGDEFIDKVIVFACGFALLWHTLLFFGSEDVGIVGHGIEYEVIEHLEFFFARIAESVEKSVDGVFGGWGGIFLLWGVERGKNVGIFAQHVI